MPVDPATLLPAIRKGDAAAWEALIGRYQGRVLAYSERRLGDRGLAEDLVQDVFLGFLTALPNYDESTPIEAFLFSIASHKLTDVLRRQGRRPLLLGLGVAEGSSPGHDPVGPARRASSIARGRETHRTVERVLGDCLRQLVQSWFSRGEFERLSCLELLFVRGLPNREVARLLDISEQAVANHKQFAVQKLKAAAEAANLRHVDWQRLVG